VIISTLQSITIRAPTPKPAAAIADGAQRLMGTLPPIGLRLGPYALAGAPR
jgi:hypothetical protein